LNYNALSAFRRMTLLSKYGCVNFKECRFGIVVDNTILIAKSKNMFKFLGELDWVHYPNIRILYNKLKNNEIKKYYKELQSHSKSPDNIWKDKRLEKSLKKHYKENQKQFLINRKNYYMDNDEF
jgi:hypothetical protein